MKEVKSFAELKRALSKKQKNFLLLYKRGSELSECAYQNIKSVSDNNDISIFIADVNQVKDIHSNYQVSSVPSLLEFYKEKHLKTIKGCHNESFFKSIMNSSLYSAGYKNSDQKKTKRVIVYSTPTCPHCTTLKNYLKENKITFRDIDVSKDQSIAQQMMRKSGQQGVPQIEINGRIVVGFDKSKIDGLLEIK